MAILNVTTTRRITVPKGCKQIESGHKEWVSFVIKEKYSVKYCTVQIDKLSEELIDDDFVVINDNELAVMQKLLRSGAPK